mgnify:CR=1 FL=1
MLHHSKKGTVAAKWKFPMSCMTKNPPLHLHKPHIATPLLLVPWEVSRRIALGMGSPYLFATAWEVEPLRQQKAQIEFHLHLDPRGQLKKNRPTIAAFAIVNARLISVGSEMS